MKVDKDTKIWKVCAKEYTRPVLTGCYLTRNPKGESILVSADGFKLAVVKVSETSEDTHDVIIPAKAIEQVTKKDRGYNFIQVNGSVDVCTPESKTNFPRIEGTFPAYEKLIPPAESIQYRIALNAKYLHELAEALGTEIVTLTFHGGTSPIKVTGNSNYGALMPCFVGDKSGLFTPEDIAKEVEAEKAENTPEKPAENDDTPADDIDPEIDNSMPVSDECMVNDEGVESVAEVTPMETEPYEAIDGDEFKPVDETEFTERLNHIE